MRKTSAVWSHVTMDGRTGGARQAQAWRKGKFVDSSGHAAAV